MVTNGKKNKCIRTEAREVMSVNYVNYEFKQGSVEESLPCPPNEGKA
jgi:hypothetical protein